MSAGHHLDYEEQTRADGVAGFLAACTCRDFAAWVEGVDPETEATLLALHFIHVDNPELGSAR